MRMTLSSVDQNAGPAANSGIAGQNVAGRPAWEWPTPAAERIINSRAWQDALRNDRSRWFNRVKVLKKSRMLICAVEKNGLSIIQRLAWLAEDKSPSNMVDYWNRFTPARQKLPFRDFLALMYNDSSWRKVIVYRNPLERFLSAYRSKCLLGDAHDGRTHCHKVFRLEDENVSLVNVAYRLRTFGRHNPHWAPQSDFCGNTTVPLWEHYTHRIPFLNLTQGLLGAFKGRVSDSALAAMSAALRHNHSLLVDSLTKNIPPSHLKYTNLDSSHVTNAGAGDGINRSLTPEVMRLLRKFYARDNALLSSAVGRQPRSSGGAEGRAVRVVAAAAAPT